MKRIHLFEFTDLSWYPQIFRRMQTDYLQFVATLGSGQKNLIPLMIRAMQHAGTREIVDLCSGGGGPWGQLQKQFMQDKWQVKIKLTDKYPNLLAVQKWKNEKHLGIDYLSSPVDALKVPEDLIGMRTLFEAFHHFKPEQARSILRDAKERKVAIGIFDISVKSPLRELSILWAPLTTLLSYLIFTPFIKPYKFWRFLWTYLLPFVPLATCWDGVISMLRGYSIEEMKELINPLEGNSYAWEIGLAPSGTPIFVYTFLIGYPV